MSTTGPRTTAARTMALRRRATVALAAAAMLTAAASSAQNPAPAHDPGPARVMGPDARALVPATPTAAQPVLLDATAITATGASTNATTPPTSPPAGAAAPAATSPNPPAPAPTGVSPGTAAAPAAQPASSGYRPHPITPTRTVGPATPAGPGLPPPGPTRAQPAPAAGDRPYLQQADWLWAPIPASPVLDRNSAAMAASLAGGRHVANIGDFGVTLLGPDGIDAATPRHRVRFDQTGDWGPDPFAGKTVPIPPGTPIAPGSDGHLAIADPTTATIYNLWMARPTDTGWHAGWGAAVALHGDGRETHGSSTGSGLARFAAVVRDAEIAAGVINHALFFSTDMVTPQQFRYPATKTDGSNMTGSANPIPEGARIQLDPTLDLDTLPGLTRAEKIVAKALQTYGAYVGDNGGTRMAFLFEYQPGSTAYRTTGLNGAYGDLNRIPYHRLRVLQSWNGR